MTISNLEFDKILASALSYWPEKMCVSERIYSGTNGVRFPELVTLHDEIEGKVFEEGDDLLRFMDWALYCSICSSAKYMDFVRPGELCQEVIKKKFEEDLERCEELRDIFDLYINNNPK